MLHKRKTPMLIINKNGAIFLQGKDNKKYIPTFETEKDKPNSLYVDNSKKEEGLSNA